VAYAQGARFSWTASILLCVIVSVASLLLAFVGSIAIKSSDSFNLRLALFMPVILFSVMAHMTLGWAFYVRWSGIDGAIFLILTALYAFTEAISFSNFILGTNESEIATLFVLIPRVLLTCGFIALACSSDNSSLNIDKPMYWPESAIIPRYRLSKLPALIGAGLSTALAVISQFEKVLNVCRWLEICH
jgi:hypothetical protein